MQMTVTLSLLSTAVLLAVLTPEADAALTTHEIRGAVTSVSPLVAADFAVGQPVVHRITFDDAVPDTNPDSSLGFYLNALSAASGSIGDFTYAADGITGGMFVLNDEAQSGDSVTHDAFSDADASTSNGYLLLAAAVSISDPTANAFGSAALSELPPSDFALTTQFSGQASVFQFVNAGSSVIAPVRWEVAGWTVVPEPTMPLAAFLLGMLSTIRRWPIRA